MAIWGLLRPASHHSITLREIGLSMASASSRRLWVGACSSGCVSVWMWIIGVYRLTG